MDANFVRGKNIYDYLIKNSHKASKIFLHENKGLCAEYVRTIVLEYARRPSIQNISQHIQMISKEISYCSFFRFCRTSFWWHSVHVNMGNIMKPSTRTHLYSTSSITRMPSGTRYRRGTESWPPGSPRGRGSAPGQSLRGRRKDRWMVSNFMLVLVH